MATDPCGAHGIDRKSTRLNSSHVEISYAVFCLKKKKNGRPGHRNRCLSRMPHQDFPLRRSFGTCQSASCGTAACSAVFFFNDTATTEIYTLSLHDALPI